MNPSQIQAQEIELKDILENNWNPNLVEDKKIEGLKHMIETKGMLQPILLVENAKIPELKLSASKYTIVDGAHRFKACMSLGLKTILANIVDFKTINECKFTTVSMNAVRGEMDKYRYSALIEELAKVIDVADLAKRLGITATSIKKMQTFDVAGFEPPKFENLMTSVNYRYFRVKGAAVKNVHECLQLLRKETGLPDTHILIKVLELYTDVIGTEDALVQILSQLPNSDKK